ncbi:fasciclin-like arabinogalactan protein 21 [Primulina eburnea]|uniref:fasciclin-like arabinogalactan protein 21 n=1 Tax=Primulina eburnea TaxID=1245227 RepID=UPI003C6BE1C8
MAIPLRFQLLLLLLLLILISLFISAAAAPPLIQEVTPSILANLLSTLGFQKLSTANLSASSPITIFAPSDAAVSTCPTCSLHLLIREFSLPGLYPLQFLQSLVFGTKIETLAPHRCLTITTAATADHNKNKVYVNGVEIARPDLFNDGTVLVHGLQGFVSHLSPLSCNVELMTSLSFPFPSLPTLASSPSPSPSLMPLMLKDAILRLQTIGYGVVSMALRFRYPELVELKAMTVFAVDDNSIFTGEGSIYLSNFLHHVVPNKRLTAADLVTLRLKTSLPTMEAGQDLVVTTAGGGGTLTPMKINHMKLVTIDLMHNAKMVIHGISSPFPRVQQYQEAESDAEIQRSRCGRLDWDGGICVIDGQGRGGLQSTADVQDHDRGL